jgi:dipeptidyl aminopeptidase/acylaminoacyl peptidase
MEFGQPAWSFDTATYRFLDGGQSPNGDRILCTPVVQGRQLLAVLEDGALAEIPSPLVAGGLPLPFGDRLAAIGAGEEAPGGLALIDPGSGALQWLRRGTDLTLDPADVARAEPFSYPAEDGAEAHAFFYPPTNRAYAAPAGEKPPLIVMSHGGPTGATGTAFTLKVQFWTSRGFAVVDVNYGGSTGYGRAYRARLDGRWGIVDAAGCIGAARHLAAAGKVDGRRMAIRGGSAGGYTTLCALTFHDDFAAGTSLYGIGDLMALAEDTHKFESRYLDRLIGPLPEARALYDARSPLKHAAGLSCPVLFLQGLEDKVVPPNQAEAMVAALKAKGLPVAYLAFEGEGHGFRRADTIERALKAELAFYGQVFGFQPAGELAKVEL